MAVTTRSVPELVISHAALPVKPKSRFDFNRQFQPLYLWNVRLSASALPPNLRIPPLTLEPQLPRPACSPQYLQSTQVTASTAEIRKSAYASVLEHRSTSPPQPTSKSNQPAPPSEPTLAIEDLYRQFHNKPSPFKPNKTRKRPANRDRNKNAFATQSLSRFLSSTLPAFSRFLTEMQPNEDNFCPTSSRSYYSCAMEAA